jgi:hypothetical protein
MGFLSSFFSGATDGGGYTGAEDGGYGLEGGLGQSSGPGGGYTGAEDGGYGLEGGLGQSSVPGKAAPGGGVGPSLAGKAVEAAKSMFTVRGRDGKPNVPLTVLDIAARGLIPGYGIVRGGMSAIDAIFGPTTMTAEEAAAEQENYTALAEASLSPSIPPYLLSQGQQDPAAQQALFGPTHIYGALPGQARRRGAYQYIPPTFGPRS